MLPRWSLIEEASQKERASARTLNIVFLDVAYVLCEHFPQERIMHASETAEIKSDPRIAQKIPSAMLETLNVCDLVAVLKFPTKAVENLRQLCEENNAKIVISSSWGNAKSLAQSKALFSVSNFEEYILDSIPSMRGREIEKWLREHFEQVNSFVVLTDPETIRNSERFGQRYVRCTKLLSNDAILHQATHVLREPLQFENSTPKLLLDAIQRNSPQVMQVEFNEENMCALKIGYGWDAQMLITRLSAALENNSFITHLTLKNFCFDGPSFDIETREESSADLLKRIAALLQSTTMKLAYLNISHNSFSDFSALLSVLDGDKVHIPHICLNANPVKEENQIHLANWMKTYPAPIKLDLDFSNSGWGRYRIDSCLIQAAEDNPHITLSLRDGNFNAYSAPFNRESLNRLVAAGRIELVPEEDRGLLYAIAKIVLAHPKNV